MGKAQHRLKAFPETFPKKGRYPTYDRSWNPTGYADDPQYPGQMPVEFPEDAAPIECFMGGYLPRLGG